MTYSRSAVASLIALLSAGHVLADGVDYALRQNPPRYEGKRSYPRAGLMIELLSATLPSGKPTANPSRLAEVRLAGADIKGEGSKVYIQVRELKPRHYYNMDAVVTAQALAKFSWPTHAVIDLLKLNPQELGLVARIGRREPSSSEWVAPGVLRLPDASSPTSVYQFVFSVGPRAKLTCKIFGRNRGQPVEKQEFPDIPGGGLLVFNWKPEDREKGEYRLVVGGEAKVTGARIYQEVIFLHDPAFEMGKE